MDPIVQPTTQQPASGRRWDLYDLLRQQEPMTPDQAHALAELVQYVGVFNEVQPQYTLTSFDKAARYEVIMGAYDTLAQMFEIPEAVAEETAQSPE